MLKMSVKDSYLFFYGHLKKDGYLSNFSNHSFKELDITFNSVEQYMHYHKALLFKDEDIANKILAAKKTLETKKLGRKVHNFTNEIWSLHKKNIVKNGLILKFTQNEDIKKKLIDTGTKILVEAAGGRNADRIWGIGYGSSNAMENIDNWGQNLLGQLLMEVRNEL